MNNLILLNEALNCLSIDNLEDGINKINDVSLSLKPDRDTAWRNNNLWEYETNHGFIYEFAYSKINPELQKLVSKLFPSFSVLSRYIDNESDSDLLHPGDCNGFLGIDFSGTTISENRQIIDNVKYQYFINACAENQAQGSINGFWDRKEELFTHLVFCENVWSQINHLSVNDDRFKLILDKLKKLNNCTMSWNTGTFDFLKLGLDCSPDTPTRIKNTENLRTFHCPQVGNRVFSLHIKWYFGSEPFRLYFYPEPTNRKVFIGYIGAKDEIGF